MKLQQLRHFLAVVDSGSLSEAAQRCHISQPSMSASLHRLEEDVDKQLFIRHARGLTPTDSGRRLQQYATRILQTVEEARLNLDNEPANLTGRLRVGVTETISAYLLPRLLRWQQTMLPELSVTYIEDDIAGMQRRVKNGELDLGVMVTDNIAADPALRCDVLFSSPRRLWLSPGHPLLQQDKISLVDVAAYPFVLLEMDEHISTWSRYWQASPVRPEVVFQSHSIEAVRSMVGRNVGITILSDMVFRPWTLDGEHLSRRTLDAEVPGMDIGVLRVDASDSTEIQAFVDMLYHHLRRDALLEQQR
ncbi:putative transcriptional regulator protein [Salinisphaera shabanensis E1L3A]|uniref:Transcriptional regulator protein n=1 Tax=Salinisphaera shabanensis E1L3A TaxID=1033802 RepID=U2G157_9GAMM|nr:LysR substrate-binding domain-containing protein [Salinisphaera shabanensis]ERJ19983.1 putative transcriptional regulator protein [Salinisphaera shabanensis E1L3A]